MARRRRFSSNTIRTVGALLPSDVLSKAMAGEGLEGLEVEDYGFDSGDRLRDVVNDAWNESRAHWWRLQTELRELSEDDLTATALTREIWLLPLLELLGFDDIEVISGAITVGGTDSPISHMQGTIPLHLMGARVELDARVPGIRGAARLSPHSLVQQFLNRSDDHLWAMVTNGKRLRILRDSVSLTRQAFVEFDLEAMFNGEVFPDFVLLYKVAHVTRFAGDRPEDCLLERWIAAARDEGIRALDQLREGVETALTTLGTGFLRHRDNQALRDAVKAGDVDAKEMYRYLLRLIYRLLFLFVAEDRDLLLIPDASPEARERYEKFYSTARLRELASRPTGSGHADLWRGLTALMDVLGRDEGEPSLGLAGMGSFLWSADAIGPLSDGSLDNEDLLVALRGLAYVQEDGVLRRIDFAAMGAEELGSVYESLLELHPAIDETERSFMLGGGAGSERKTTGSYYTPTELISELLDSALDPVLEEAAAKEDPEQAILDLKVVDPAAGSGHFLVAAAHRIGKKLAEVRTGEPEPPVEAYRTAVRDVVSRCLYAVDLNDLAVELCKVSLWLEALEPGKPLSFLDHHILQGNSLFGVTPAAIADGIPDDAFVALTGDDKKVVSVLKKRNKKERQGQDTLGFDENEVETLGSELVALEEFDDTDLETVRAKERLLAEWKDSPAYAHARFVADAWCAAFAIAKTTDAPPLTESVFRRIKEGTAVDDSVRSEIERLHTRFGFLHWHLAFPQVFRIPDDVPADGPGWVGGFDVVLGNPPWDKVEFSEREWFASPVPGIAAAAGATRKEMIATLESVDPTTWHRYRVARREVEALRHFVSASGRYPLTGRGRVNTYALFAELMRVLVEPTGRVGVVLPTGIATDDTTKHFFADLVERRSLVSLFDFENRKKIFPGIDSRIKFCLLTLTGPARPVAEAEFCFFAHSTLDLRDEDRRFALTPEDFKLLNPNTRTCPIFRTRRDAEITKGIYRRIPVLVDESRADGNPWRVRFQQGMFNMASDSHLFRTRNQLDADGWTLCGNVFERGSSRRVPMYEGKMIHLFDHRFATFEPSGSVRDVTEEERNDPTLVVLPRYWVAEYELDRSLGDSYFGIRRFSRATDERTAIAADIPWTAIGDSVVLAHCERPAPALLAVVNSYVVDFVVRQKQGGTNLNIFILKQIAIPGPGPLTAGLHRMGMGELDIRNRVQELRGAFLPLSVDSPVCYDWDPSRREALQAELHAIFFHLYGIEKDDVDYIMETFPIVKRHDIAEHGSYRTKELILDVYDRMTTAIETGEPYQTTLDPPPADASLRVDAEAPE